MTLAGFSFGALVSLSASATASPVRLISVAPPVRRAQAESLVRPACPWLIVQGDADEIVDFREVQAFAAQLKPPAQLQLLPGAEHFFHGRLDQLRTAVLSFMDSQPPPLERPSRG